MSKTKSKSKRNFALTGRRYRSEDDLVDRTMTPEVQIEYLKLRLADADAKAKVLVDELTRLRYVVTYADLELIDQALAQAKENGL